MPNKKLSQRPWLITLAVVVAAVLTLVALTIGYFEYHQFRADRQSGHIERIARLEVSRLEPDATYRSNAEGSISCPSDATDNWFGGSSACIGSFSRTFGFSVDESVAQQKLVAALRNNGWASDRSNPPSSLHNVIKVADGDVYVVRWDFYTRDTLRQESEASDLRPEARESWRRAYAAEQAVFDGDPAIRTVVTVRVSWLRETRD